MKILADGSLVRYAEIAKWHIEKYEKLLNYAIKQGFSDFDDVTTWLHNEQAYWMNKVLNDSNNELIAVVWKDGSVHIYNRISYCNHKFGRKKSKYYKWEAAQND